MRTATAKVPRFFLPLNQHISNYRSCKLQGSVSWIPLQIDMYAKLCQYKIWHTCNNKKNIKKKGHFSPKFDSWGTRFYHINDDISFTSLVGLGKVQCWQMSTEWYILHILYLCVKHRVRIRRYRIAKCDTISTNCYAFAQNASQKVRRIVFCENEWVIAPLTSVKNRCWSMFSKPKSSNLTSIDDCYIKTSPGKHLPFNMHLFWVDVFTIPTPCNFYKHALHTTDTEEHNTWS